MSEQTKIEWRDSTFNPWIGCTKVSSACDDCYAARSTPARRNHIEWGAGKPRVRTGADNWRHPKRWNDTTFFACDCGFRGAEPAQNGAVLIDGRCVCPVCHGTNLKRARRRVFSASLGDWLDNEVPIEWFVDFLDLIRRTPNLDWLLLTKRIGNWLPRLAAAENRALIRGQVKLSEWIASWANGYAPENVWIGATVINQAEADRDVPKLLAVPARIRFLSIEPMLGPIRLDAYHDWLGRSPGGFFCPDCPEHGVGIDPAEHRGCLGEITDEQPYEGIDWVIAGGESGSRARPSHPDWFRSLRDQCIAAGIPFLFKQWGEWLPEKDATFLGRGSSPLQQWVNGGYSVRVGKKAAGRLLDGVEHNGFPKAA